MKEKVAVGDRYFSAIRKPLKGKTSLGKFVDVNCDTAPKVYAMIDKLAKIGVIHKNKAANLKSGIAVYINKLS